MISKLRGNERRKRPQFFFKGFKQKKITINDEYGIIHKYKNSPQFFRDSNCNSVTLYLNYSCDSSN